MDRFFSEDNFDTVLVAGHAGYPGAVLVRKFLNAGHTVKAPEKFIYRDEITWGLRDLNTVRSVRLSSFDDTFWGRQKMDEVVRGCDIVVYWAKDQEGEETEIAWEDFKFLVDAARISGVKRFIYVAGKSNSSSRFCDYLKESAVNGFATILINSAGETGDSQKQNVRVAMEIHAGSKKARHMIPLYRTAKTRVVNRDSLSENWYETRESVVAQKYAEGVTDICLLLSETALNQICKDVWARMSTYRIFLNQVYGFKKLSKLLESPHIPGGGYLKEGLVVFKRWMDVFFMMFLLHVRPEQTYRFSTRHCLPSPAERLKEKERAVIPYELNASKSSYMPKMGEINVVMRGASFDINRLETLKGPIFLSSFFEPIVTNVDVTYVSGGAAIARRLGKLGCKVIHFEIDTLEHGGSTRTNDLDHGKSWYNEFIAQGVCKRISLLQKIYARPASSFPVWAPTGSALPTICALSFFAEKINIYGWDFYLESSPETMSYWQLFSRLYKCKLDVLRSKTHLESAMLNFYYGYHLSQLPHIKIHGRLGELQKHSKLIGKISRALFNT